MSETRMLNGKDHISLLAKCNDDTYVARTAKHILERHEKANNALAKMGISARYELYYDDKGHTYTLALNRETEEKNIRFEKITDAYLRSIGSICADYWAMGETSEDEHDDVYLLYTKEYATKINDFLLVGAVAADEIKRIEFENKNANKTLEKLGIQIRLKCACSRFVGRFAIWAEHTDTKRVVKSEEYSIEDMAVGMREMLRCVYWDNVDEGTF